MSIFSKVGSWISSLFKEVTTDILPVVSEFLNVVKAVVESPVAGTLFGFIPDNIGTELLAWLKVALPKVTADFDLIVDLTSASTPAEVNAELQKAFATVVWKDATAKEKFLTTFGAQLFQAVHELADGTHFTIGTAATLLEGFYKGLIDAEGNTTEAVG